MRWLAAVLAVLSVVPVRAMGSPRADAPPWLLAYRLTPGRALRYEISADIHGSVPLFNNPEPVDANATIQLVYRATPQKRQPDGATVVRLRVESVDVEVEKIPVPLPLEQAQKFLDQDVTLSKSGEVVGVQGGEPLPFNVSIPGVDPKRLYTLLFPIVFQDVPVRPGDTWPFRSELLGGEGAPAEFSATVLAAPAVGPAPRPSKPQAGRRAAADPAPPVRVQERMRMTLDQKLDAARKPTTDESAARRTRQGSISGSGTFAFDRSLGLFTSGVVDIDAGLLEKVLGQPQEGEPAQTASTVKARVRVKLLPSAARPSTPAARRPTRKSK